MPRRDAAESMDSSSDTWSELDCSSVASSAQWTLVDDDEESSHWSSVTSLPSKRSSASFPSLKPISECTATCDADFILSQAISADGSEWKDESRLKLERASQYGAGQNKYAHLHGKRGRRNHRSSNKDLARASFERHAPFDSQPNFVKDPTKREYKMTAFDMIHPGSISFDRKKQWDLLLPDLIAHADFALSTKHQSDQKKFLFDLPVQSVVVDERRKSAVMDIRERISLSLRKRRIPSKLQYFKFREDMRPLRPRHAAIGVDLPTANDESVFLDMIRPAGVPPAVVLNAKEEYASVRMKFVSRATNPVSASSLSTDNMMRESLIYDELRREKQYSYGSFDDQVGQIVTSSFNHNLCWISEPPPHADYDEWFMEIDLGLRHAGGRFVKAIVMQGQLPVVESFPSANHFASNDDYRRYTGLIFPIARWQPLEQQCWVERFEVSARSQKGAWFSLGVFRGNCDAWSQVRVDLPAVAEMKLRFLRIRPLSKNKQGFHGPSPAFRIGVVSLAAGSIVGATVLSASGQTTRDVSSTLSIEAPDTVERLVRNLPPCPRNPASGYVRYQVLLPHTELRTPVSPNSDDGALSGSRKTRTVVADRRYLTYRHYKEGDKFWRKFRPPAQDIAHAILSQDRHQSASEAIRNSTKEHKNSTAKCEDY